MARNKKAASKNAIRKKQKTCSVEYTKNVSTEVDEAKFFLTRLLGSMSLEHFLEEYFEKKPLVVRKADSKEQVLKYHI